MFTVRRLLALGVVATTAAYVGLVAPNASANTVGFPGDTTDKGRIELTSTADTLTVTRYGPGAEGEQIGLPLTVPKSNKCRLDSAGLDPLLKIRAIRDEKPAVLGYVNNGLGISSNNTCSTANGRFGATEWMELTLGQDLISQGIVVDYARLDIEGKFGTSLGYKRVDASGKETIAPDLEGLWSGSDNGSDSGSSDNTDVFIGKKDDASDNFVKLSITPTSVDGRGQISLEAGGDYGAEAAAHRTTFWLVQQTEGYEYALKCGDVKPETAGGIGDSADFVATKPDVAAGAVHPIEATVARYSNGTDINGVQIPCTPIGADLSSDGNFNVLLRKTTKNATGVEQNPRVRFELVWVVPTSLIGEGTDPFQRFIDLDGIDWTGASPDPFPRVPAPSCTSFTPDPSLDPVDGFLNVDKPGIAVHPANTPWCVIGELRTPAIMNGVPVIIQRMFWDGQGDPKFF